MSSKALSGVGDVTGVGQFVFGSMVVASEKHIVPVVLALPPPTGSQPGLPEAASRRPSSGPASTAPLQRVMLSSWEQS